MLPDTDKTKEQLINELAQMRQQIVELEASETEQAGDKIQQQSEFLNNVLDSLAYSLYVIDANDFTIMMANPAAKLGKLSENSTCYALTHNRDKPCRGVEHVCPLQEVKKTRKPVVVEHIHYDEDGNARNAEVHGYPIFDSAGNVIQMIECCLDITERKKAEASIIEEKLFNENIVNNTPAGIAILDNDFILRKCNPDYANLIRNYLTCTPEEALGMCYFDYAPGSRPQVEDWFTKVRDSGKVDTRYGFILELDSAKGKIVTCWDTSVAPMISAEGKTTGILILTRDVTERKQVEEKLQQSEERYRVIFEDPTSANVYFDTKGRLALVNTKAAQIIGKPVKDIIGKHMKYVYPARSVDMYLARVRHAVETGEIVEYTDFIESTDKWFLTRVVPTWGVSGKIMGVQASTRDITERKQVEEKLQQSEENLRAYLESAPDGIYINDLKGTFLYGNKKAEEIMGYKREELVGKSFLNLKILPGKHLAKAGKLLALSVMGKPTGPDEFEMIRKDGSHVWVEINTTPIKQQESMVVIGFVRNITERKEAEEALRESEERYRALMSMGDRVGEAVIMLQDNEQGDGIHTFVSDQWPRITGYSREELLGMSFFDLLHPEDRQASRKRHKRKMSGESIPGLFEMSVIRKDGAEVPVEVTSAYTTYRGEHTNVAFIRDITERKRVEEEVASLAKFPSENPNPVLRIAQNGTILYANKASLPLFSIWGCRVGQLLPDYLLQPVLGVLDSGLDKYIEVECGERTFSFMFAPIVEAGYINLYGRDITDFKRAEAERGELEQKAQLASRLASVGEMAAGVAHEINNPLTGVIGFAQLLMRKNIPDDIKESVKVINDGAQRVADIINRLLTFARQRKPERGYVDINEIIETTLSLRAYEMETANIKVTPRLAPDLPRTMADSGQLQQLFLNIIINAETEMKLAHGRGSLLIKTETIGSSISISFKDDGPGIARKNLGRIFDPFFTTREVGSGTGLGLSLCHGIVAEHNGYIYARSRLGSGATFVVELPIVIEDKQLGLPEPTADEAERVAGAKILVVDDEPAVLQLLEQVLTDAGHEVVTTDHADDALAKIKRGQYNLILLDIKLPGMSGIELYKRIQKVSGSLASRVIFITGDIMGADTRDFFSQTKAHYITKPLDIEQLKREIDSQLYQGA